MLDRSFGIVPFRIDGDVIRLLLVWEEFGKGHWNFPRGRPESDENKIQTALRELSEETGLIPKVIISEHPIVQIYNFRHRGKEIKRRVEYFVALIDKGRIELQLEEVSKFRWMTLEEILKTSPFPELKKTARMAHRTAVEYIETQR